MKLHNLISFFFLSSVVSLVELVGGTELEAVSIVFMERSKTKLQKLVSQKTSSSRNHREKDLWNEETLLAEQMKNDCCDESGKETNPAKAAQIFYQIGLIYRKRSPNKISLIKCVGLLNAAIVRNPPIVDEIKRKLSKVCRHILKSAKAKDQNIDLLEVAEQVKISFNELRNEVEKFLNSPAAIKIPPDAEEKNLHKLKRVKISAIKHINYVVADKYKQIMADLSHFCEDVMGKPPCAYAIVGMGSLAREEITPYSDFEHFILLCDDKNYESYLEYFRWYSVIFHTIILNIQETIIPSLNIKSLNYANSPLGNWYFDAYTPRGISFDGMMPHACKFPLGRTDPTKRKPWTTELIKPVKKMLKYLSSEADLKNGYHLADILTRTCFVFGNEYLFQQFEDGATNYRKRRSTHEIVEEVKKQVKEDLNKFSTRFCLANLKAYDSINIKQLVYRSTTIFIAALASLRNISSHSCFDVINEMAKNNQITQNMAHHLSFAIAIACEMRMRVYIENKSQCDNAIDLKNDGIQKFLDIVGLRCTINYFQIAYCLQCEVAKQLRFTKLHFYSDPQLINITISLAFGVIGNITSSVTQHKLKIDWNLLEFDFSTCIEQLQTSNYANKVTSIKEIDMKQIESLLSYLYEAQINDEVLEFCKHMLIHHQNKSSDESTDADIADTYYNISTCMAKSQQFDDALSVLKKSLQIYQNLSLDQERDYKIAQSVHFIGTCYVELHRFEFALKYLEQSLVIWQNIQDAVECSDETAGTLGDYGNCLRNLGQYDKALLYLQKSLQLYQATSCDRWKDSDVANALNRMGACLHDMQQFEDALHFYMNSLVIMESTSLDKQKDERVAGKLRNIGGCLFQMHQLDDALDYYKRSLKIYRNRSLNQHQDYDVADLLHWIGYCLLDMHHHNNALDNFRKSLDIYEQLPPNYDVASKIATIREGIKLCSQGVGNK